MHVCIWMYTYIHTYHIYIHACMHTHIIHKYIHTYIHTCVCVYIYFFSHLNIYICVLLLSVKSRHELTQSGAIRHTMTLLGILFHIAGECVLCMGAICVFITIHEQTYYDGECVLYIRMYSVYGDAVGTCVPYS